MHTPPSWPGTGREKVCPAPPRKKQPLPRPQKLATCGGGAGQIWLKCWMFILPQNGLDAARTNFHWLTNGQWPPLLTKDTCKLFVWESVYQLIYVLFCPTPPCGFSPLPAPPRASLIQTDLINAEPLFWSCCPCESCGKSRQTYLSFRNCILHFKSTRSLFPHSDEDDFSLPSY